MSGERTYGTFEAGNAAGTSEVIILEYNEQPRRWNTNTIIIWVCSLAVLFALLVWLWGFLSNVWAFMLCTDTIHPRRAPKIWNDFKNQSFAVGFDLTAGYGTAAVAFNNGTIVDVARAEGNLEYNEVLARLSLKSSTHPTPPYFSCGLQTDDLGRQWRQYIRRRLGHPASTDVAALASVLSSLKLQTNSFLASYGLEEMELAFITAPYLPALYAEDLVDAAEFAGFQALTLPGGLFSSPGSEGAWVVSEINCAFAGMGLGLPLSSYTFSFSTSTSTSTSDAKIIEAEPRNDSVLSVLFTDTALTAHVSYLISAAHFNWPFGAANFSLGLSSSHTDDAYWEQVRVALRTALDTPSWYRSWHSLGHVLVYGENAHHPTLNTILKEEVRDAQDRDGEEEIPVFLSRDPVFAAGRGAAILGAWCKGGLRSGYTCFPDLRPRWWQW